MPIDHLIPRDDPIEAGESAPDFTLPDQDRNDWTLSEHAAAGDVVLCFYPMDFTGVCGTENACITSQFESWRDRGVQIVGISCDSFACHKAWADQMGFKHTLLADMHREVCRAYGIYFPALNVAGRGTVIVGRDADGTLRVKWSQARGLKQAMDLKQVLGEIG